MTVSEAIFVFIPARGGSKGVPEKALQTVGNAPLISYTIRDAHHIQGRVRVFVSTDDARIARVSMSEGADVPFLRPVELAGDSSRLEDALSYSLHRLKTDEQYDPDILIVMSPTSPFRLPGRVNDALTQSLGNPSVYNIGSVAPAGIDRENYWTVEHGTCRRFSETINADIPPERLFQSSMSFNIVFLKRSENMECRIPVILNDIESVDIDTPYDLELARRIVESGYYPFETQSPCSKRSE